MIRDTLKAALVAAGLLAGTAGAYTLEEFHFDSPAQEAEFRELIGKLRCLVCQNESLAASQADLAQDLRNEVYRMMREGQAEDQILDFLVARYGDFVLYDPPLKPSNYILWFGPFVLIGIAGFFMARAIVRQRREPERELDPAERACLDALLAGTATSDSPDADTKTDPRP